MAGGAPLPMDRNAPFAYEPAVPMPFKPHPPKAMLVLQQAGVHMVDPSHVWIDNSIPLSAIAAHAVLYPGVRIVGASSRVDAYAVLGEGGPVTLDNSWVGEKAQVGQLGSVHLQHSTVGPHSILGAGSAEHAVFLGREVSNHGYDQGHTCGVGFRVRRGSLYEEDANSAQFTDCKMTILFPWVTLGGHVNFCDTLVSGGHGSTPGRFSEIGSGTVHFNFTPRGDKATGSCFGNVRQGLLLNQAPLFIGGNSSLIGPLQAEFGALTPAVGNYRNALKKGFNPAVNPSVSQPKRNFDTRIYGQVKRVIASQVRMIAELMVLRTWYVHMRLHVSAGFGSRHALYQQGERAVCLNMEERLAQLLAMVDRLEGSVVLLESDNKVAQNDVRIVQQRKALEQRGDMAKALQPLVQSNPDTMLRPPSALQEALMCHWDAQRGVYTKAVQALAKSHQTETMTWLKAVYAQALPRHLL